MFGDSFFTRHQAYNTQRLYQSCFRPHVWGFFFHTLQYIEDWKVLMNSVFVPMFGDSFFTMNIGILVIGVGDCCFRPHVWGFFFHHRYLLLLLGVVHCFRPHVWGFFFHSRPGMPHGVGSLWPFCGGDFQLIGILIIFTL